MFPLTIARSCSRGLARSLSKRPEAWTDWERRAIGSKKLERIVRKATMMKEV